jgi:predicted regulator of Ras-like GTPase activity (Roadblock/LC7/MglB family)
MVKKKIVQETAVTDEPVEIEGTSLNDDDALRRNLEEIKAEEGVIGYIMRNSASADIEIKDPAKIIDYALLSSSALDASEELATLFDLGNVKDIVVQTSNVKVLSFKVNEAKISVFMEKDVDFNQFLRKLQAI